MVVGPREAPVVGVGRAPLNYINRDMQAVVKRRELLSDMQTLGLDPFGNEIDTAIAVEEIHSTAEAMARLEKNGDSRFGVH